MNFDFFQTVDKRRSSDTLFINMCSTLFVHGHQKLQNLLPKQALTSALTIAPEFINPTLFDISSDIECANHFYLHSPLRNNLHRRMGSMAHNQNIHHIMAHQEIWPFGADELNFIFMPFLLNSLSKCQRGRMFSEAVQCMADDATVLIMGINKPSFYSQKCKNKRQKMSNNALFCASINGIMSECASFNLELVASEYFHYSPFVEAHYQKRSDGVIKKNNLTDINYNKRIDKMGDRWWPTMANGYFLLLKEKPNTISLRCTKVKKGFKRRTFGASPSPSYCVDKHS